MKNILYIHTHDTGRYTSVYGENVPTNYLKEFSKEALVYRKAFSVSPTCSPSRASLLTGTYPSVSGMKGLSQRGFSLKNNKMHLAQFLRNNGFTTVLCGIQHEQGYWVGEGTLENSKKLGYTHNITTKPEEKPDDWVEWDKENTNNTIKFIKEQGCNKKQGRNNKSFFLSCGFFQTHREYPRLNSQEKKIYDENFIALPQGVYDNKDNRSDTARLHKSLAIFDECFKDIVEALKEVGIYNETIIICTTDHGLANPFSKCNLEVAGTGVQLIIRSPEHKNTQGAVNNALVSHLDVFPTVCDLLNLDKPTYLQGSSLIKTLESNKNQVNKYIYGQINFHTSYEPIRSIRSDRYCLIKYLDNGYKYFNLSNCDDSSIKDYLLANGWQKLEKRMVRLYDLYFDPEEKNDISGENQYQGVLEELEKELDKFIQVEEKSLLSLNDYLGRYKVNKKTAIKPSITTPEDAESLIDY